MIATQDIENDLVHSRIVKELENVNIGSDSTACNNFIDIIGHGKKQKVVVSTYQLMSLADLKQV